MSEQAQLTSSRPHSDSGSDTDNEWDHDEAASFWAEQDRGQAAQEEMSAAQRKKAEAKSRTMDKLLFVAGVTNIVLLAAFFFKLHAFAPWYYSIKFPLLVGLRYFTYRKHKWQLFLLDFCYAANALILAYLWLFPTNELVGNIAFALSMGPLLWAALAFRNSLVFHSLDKISSCFIHVSPALTMFIVRWYPKEASEHWHSTFVFTTDEDDEWLDWCEMVGLGLAYFVLHQFVYYFVVQVMLIDKLRKDKDYLTSFRFFAAQKGSTAAKIINCKGRKWKVLVWGLLNDCYCLMTLLLVPLWKHYFEAGLFAIIIVCGMVTWNGAGFYMHVFSKRYEGEVKQRAQTAMMESAAVTAA